MMLIKKKPGKSGNLIATIAIGDKYFDLWEKHAFPLWIDYCERHDLGLIVFTDNLISESSSSWKKATWQKLLIGDFLKENLASYIANICYVDTDILINPFSPNIFEFHDDEFISLVSKRSNLPYTCSEDTLKKHIAFNRNKFYSSDYPLDSSLFISLKDLYGFHNMAVQKDEACMGLIVFNVNNFSSIMKSWFMKYDSSIKSITNNGDQTHLNYEIQNHGKVKWLDYRFQALWVYEMAIKFPFLYELKNLNHDLIIKSIQASLTTNYFLHFAGSWHESKMWLTKGIIDKVYLEYLNEFSEYEKLNLSGKPIGMVSPKK
jgi:hypothetical protein